MIDRGNGCNSEGCNVLQMVEIKIAGLMELQKNSTDSIQALITEKFDSIKANSIKEADRINELRRGDLEAVRIANDSTVKRAELLSLQLVENAETIRKSTETLASNIALQSKQVTDRQDEKITKLEQSSWMSSGKEGASPDVQAILTKLLETKNENAGIAKGSEITKSNIYKAIGGAVGITALIIFLIEKLL